MTVVLKTNDGSHNYLCNVTLIRVSTKKDCDHCAVDTFNNEYHFSDKQLVAIRG